MPVLGNEGYPQTGANRTRAQVRAELGDLSGGGNKTDIKAKADRAWDAAVREFNSVAWSFNRVQEDIVIGSHMKDPLQPTVTNTGSGDGIVLTAGASIDYWIEERVKEGNRIIRRSAAVNPAVVKTITVGVETTWKPVITPGAMQNPDTTHYAIIRSGTYGPVPGVQSASASSTFPNTGAELIELPVATASYEDQSVGVNPMQPSGANGKLYFSGEFDLPFPFRNFTRAHWVDEQGHERTSLVFVPWRQATIFMSRFTTVSRPIFVTLRNLHSQGKMILHPRPQGKNMVWPVIRLTYSTYIGIAGPEDDAVLDVPQEADTAIFMRAAEIFVARLKGANISAPMKPETLDARLALEQQYRDWEDS
jgi:hypothetical protein